MTLFQTKPIFLLIVLLHVMSCAGSNRELAVNASDMDIQRLRLPEQQSMPTERWDGSKALEPGLAGKRILLFEDFEASDYKKNWPVYWGEPVGAGTVSSPLEYVFAGKRSSYIQSHEGEHRSSGAGEYVPNTPLDEAYARLYIRLPDDFSIGSSDGLKLFSILGGARLENTYGGAGRRPTGTDKFSATLAIDNSHEVHLYYYHPDQRKRYGDFAYCNGLFCSQKIFPGRWYCLEMMLKANTPGSRDGQLKVWMDGRRIIEINKMRFRDAGEVKIRRFSIVNYWGGGQRQDTSPKDQRIYIDNYVVSSEPVGCYSATVSIAPYHVNGDGL